jgi:hypothetical protein
MSPLQSRRERHTDFLSDPHQRPSGPSTGNYLSGYTASHVRGLPTNFLMDPKLFPPIETPKIFLQ